MNNKNIIILLHKIYNTLNLISTKGEDTLYMAKCIEALKEVIQTLECAMNTEVVTGNINFEDLPDSEKEE